MNTALGRMPGIEPSFSQPIRDNVLESISQIDGQIVIKVFGDDLDDAAATGRRRCCERSSRRAAAWRGRSSTAAGEVPQLQIEIDRARAARYGLNVADIQDVIETALGGKDGDRDLGRRTALRRGRPAARRRARAILDAIRQRPRRHAERPARPAGGGGARLRSAAAA